MSAHATLAIEASRLTPGAALPSASANPLGTTPAVAAGVSDHVWKLDELIALLEDAERVPVKRGRYAKTSERRADERSGNSA